MDLDTLISAIAAHGDPAAQVVGLLVAAVLGLAKFRTIVREELAAGLAPLAARVAVVEAHAGIFPAPPAPHPEPAA